MLCMFLISGIIYGQAHEGAVEYQKSQQSAAVIEVPYSPEIVKAAMNDYLSKKGKAKGNDTKGFTSYRNTEVTDLDSINGDLNFKVERKSRKDRNISVISLLITPPSTDSSTLNKTQYFDMEEAKTYLNELVPAIEAYNLELQIKDQNKGVISAENKYKSLANEGVELERKKLAIEKKIESNKQEQLAQTAEVENQKQKLGTKVAERK